MQPDLENIKNKVEQNRDFVGRISSKLPGFKGYAEKSEMYDVDRIMRNFLSEKIQTFKNDLNLLSSALFNKGTTENLSEIDTLGTNFERVQKKCQYADYGSTATLSGAKISDEDQNRLLEYDWRLINTLEEFTPKMKEIQDDGADIKSLLTDISTKLRDFEKSFDDRKNVLMEVI